jgi:hypothetical protein
MPRAAAVIGPASPFSHTEMPGCASPRSLTAPRGAGRHAGGVAGEVRRARRARAAIAWLLIATCLFAASGGVAMELAVTVDDLPTHGPLPPGVTRRAIADQITTRFGSTRCQECTGS